MTGRRCHELVVKNELYHVLPFAWEQIQRFIRDWYHLRDDWKRKREAGIQNFLDALQNPRRSYLLTLARRPIFLTLMALVHCSRNEMPDGRGALYKAIIDLYLVRQEKHRQLKETTHGTPMPHWPDTEKRMVLGYLAFRSQIKGGDQEEDEPEKRRVVWERAAMLQTIREQLSTRRYGRFTELTPADAEELLNYFLNPAGLLTEPEEARIQFAHLSFQEYLCADFLAGRARRQYLERELFSRLGKPGWDEVGMLLLTIRAEQERNDGHFEIIAWLNLADRHQADLFIKAYTGRELPFKNEDLEEWLPVAMACALVHPDAELVNRLARVPGTIQAQGIELLIEMFEADDAAQQWEVLIKRLEALAPLCIEDCLEEYAITGPLKQRWLNPQDDSSWTVKFDHAEARTYALLNLIIASGWAKDKNQKDETDALVLSPDGKPARAIYEWLQKNIKEDSSLNASLLWGRDSDTGLPAPTNAGLALDALLPEEGALWQTAIRSIPPDGWLLQGESAEDFFGLIFSQPVVLLTLYPKQPPPPNATLALGLYQAMMILEGGPMASAFDSFVENRSDSLIRSLYRSRSLSLKNKLKKIDALIEKQEPSAKKVEPFYLELEHFWYRYAAHDWFEEQAEKPDLMKSRGLRPGEPLPQALGLFDDDGRPLPVQKRDNWVRLRKWLDDDDAVLDFFGLPKTERENLRPHLNLLRKQPWSPQAGLDAVLSDWPEDVPDWPCTLEHAEKELEKACDQFLEAIGE